MTKVLLDEFDEWLRKTQATVAFAYDPEHTPPFSGTATWGREAPDSPMAGAAAFSLGETLTEAIDALLNDAGARR